MTTSEQPVLVLDMSTLRFVTHGPRSAVRVLTRNGQLLAAVHPRVGEQRTDIAFRAMDAALREGSVLGVDLENPRLRRHLKVALYNPFSGDVSFGATPDTVSFSGTGTLALGPDGSEGVVRHTAEGPVLCVESTTLAVTDRSVTELSRVLAGHTAA